MHGRWKDRIDVLKEVAKETETSEITDEPAVAQIKDSFLTTAAVIYRDKKNIVEAVEAKWTGPIQQRHSNG